jgi:GT2 family glycosyltransferase
VNAGTPRVAICIPSYRRPQGLFSLLGALDGLAFDAPPPEVRIVVVDNDAAGSAKSVCDTARSWLRYPLRYVLEKRRGVPAARNAAVSAALDSDWIVFIDDDETPEPRWLEELLRVQAAHRADVVTGPVVPRFCEDPPRWVVEGRFFASEQRPEGAKLRTAYTHNVMVRTACLVQQAALFDERMTPNGEDTELFGRLAQSGARVVWAPRALVHERVPAERAALGWLLRRAFRVGVAASRVARRQLPPAEATRRSVAHGAWCLTRGLLQAPLAIAGRRAEGAHGLWLASFAFGRFTGLLRPAL